MNGAIGGHAAIADGAGGFVVATVTVDAPGPGEIRVRVLAAGLCHIDHASLRWPGPLVMGHEGAGHVDALGDGVVGLAVGDGVLLNWAIPCGACPQCGRGEEALCDRTRETDPARYGDGRAHPGASRWRGADHRDRPPRGRARARGTWARPTRWRRATTIPARTSWSKRCGR